jgi:hypothetical protein
MFNNQRPGVYAKYGFSGAAAPACAKTCALILNNANLSGAYEILSYDDPPPGADEITKNCLRVLFEGGAGKVLLISPGGGSPFALLNAHGGADIVVCDEGISSDELLAYLDKALNGQGQILSFVGRDTSKGAALAARNFSHQRVCVASPAVSLSEGGDAKSIYTACALAAAVLLAQGPPHHFSGMAFPSLGSAAPLAEDEIQSLLSSGVCVFEDAGGTVRLIRALTTSPAPSMRSLSAVLISDYVLNRLRQSLSSKLATKAASPDSIRDHVAVELSDLAAENIITDFSSPKCRAAKDDPTLCIVEISFSVAHLISRIHITAHITTGN